MKYMQPLLWKTSTLGRFLGLNICTNKIGVAFSGEWNATSSYMGVLSINAPVDLIARKFEEWDYIDRMRVSRSENYHPRRSCSEVLNEFTEKCTAWGNIFIMLGKPINMSHAPCQCSWPGSFRWIATVEFPCRDAFVSESVAVTKGGKKKQRHGAPVSAPSKKVNLEGTEVVVEKEKNGNVKNVKAEIGVEVFSVEKKEGNHKENGSNRSSDEDKSGKKNNNKEKGESGLCDMEKSQETEKGQLSAREKGESGLHDVEKLQNTEEEKPIIQSCPNCGHRDGVWEQCAMHRRLCCPNLMERVYRRLMELRAANPYK